MAVTRTTRFSLHRWDSGSDPVNREQSDADNLQVETLAGIFRTGLDANKGSASAASLARSFYLATDTTPVTLYYSDGTNWVTLNLYGVIGDIQSLSIGGSSSAGTASTAAGVTTQKFALADHTHAFPSAGTPSSIGTANSAGAASTISRSDHVHSIGTGAVNSSAAFASGVVDTTAIATGAVTTAKIADVNVTTAKIADSNVTTAKIADTAVTGAKLALAVAGSGLQQNGTTKALEAKVDNSTIGVNGSGQIYLISTGSASSIPDNSITTSKIVDANVTTAKIASSAVTAAKIASDVAGSGLQQAIGGALDVGVDNTTIEINTDALRVKDSGVSTAKIAALAVTTAKVADGAITTAKLDSTALSEAVTTATIRDANVTTAKIADSAVTTAKIADAGVTAAKIAAAVAGNGLSGGAGTALAVNVDGTTIAITTDTLGIAASGVGATQLAANAVTTAKILDANVTAGKLAANSVTAAKLNADTAGSGLVLNGTSNALDLNVDNSTVEVNTDILRVKDAGITAAKITSSAISASGALNGGNNGTATATLGVRVDGTTITINGSNNLAVGAIGTAQITDLNVTTGKIADLNVTTGKIADLNVTTGKIADLNVTTGKIADLNVTTGKLAANAVTGSKAGAGTYRNGTNADTGGTINYGTVATMTTATASTVGFSNGDLWLGY